MHFFPSTKVFLQIGPISIAWYAVFIITGAIIAYNLAQRKFQQMGYDKKVLEDFGFFLLPVALIGARTWYVLFEWKTYSKNPIDIIMVNQGGLAIHGGLIAGLLFGIYYFRKHKINVLRAADMTLPFMMIAQAIGRWGNFMNQEAYGPVVSESYYNYFPKFIKDMMFINGNYHAPTFLYESVGNIIGFILIYFVYKKFGRRKYGDLAFAYLAYYGMIRFYIEGLRTDSLMLFNFRIAQIISLIMILIGVIGILIPNKRKPIVAFDLDGTLIQSEKLIINSFKHTLSQVEPSLNITEAEYLSFLGGTLQETLAKYTTEVDKYTKIYRDYNEENHDLLVEVYPGAKELLKTLKLENYDIAIVSSKGRKLVDHALKLFDLEQYVDVVVTYEDTELHKPSKEPLQKACELLNRGHDDLIYIGDSVQDIQASKAIGCYSIAVVTNPLRKEAILATKPDVIVNNLEDCYPIIKEEHIWENNMI